MMSICIQNVSSIKKIPNKAEIIRWINHTLNTNNKKAEITLRIVNEEEIRALNKTWRNKDYATNILSFPIEVTTTTLYTLLGDIVICAQVVEREAKEQKKDINSHWAHLIIHGVLHLQGYDHKDKNEAEEMEAKEIQLLKEMGYKNPYKSEFYL